VAERKPLHDSIGEIARLGQCHERCGCAVVPPYGRRVSEEGDGDGGAGSFRCCCEEAERAVGARS
jgi:hypothetical protein